MIVFIALLFCGNRFGMNATGGPPCQTTSKEEQGRSWLLTGRTGHCREAGQWQNCRARGAGGHMTARPGAETDAEQESRGKRLESWKEIAGYLNRHVTTIRRWEKGEGLPVHRHRHTK